MCIRDRLSVRYSMNFWRKGVGWEWIFVIARSLELQALPYALNRPPRAAASFNPGLEILRRDSHETTEGLPPDQREWAGRLAVGEAPEAGLLGEPSWAGAIHRDCGNRQRSKAEAQPGHGCYRSATFPQGLTAVVGAG